MLGTELRLAFDAGLSVRLASAIEGEANKWLKPSGGKAGITVFSPKHT
ncbi:hypothetical protein QN372_02910 [Undibacterium sp. RTI2.1]|nr:MULTISPECIES: hypothetical protein [unclassified Undibacterium]MEB0029688.1 hypothetical protein [Undibacterium sp. RTI2.1]MEB0116159.1 hypothetical protein [Undibacterium sp. RTI2.2]